jgi:hypothetical protein
MKLRVGNRSYLTLFTILAGGLIGLDDVRIMPLSRLGVLRL